MHRTRVLFTGFCLVLLAREVIAQTNQLDSHRWRVGLSRAVITPNTSVWLAGYGTKRPPDGKLHDLWMKAMALEDRFGNRVVLVTSDFQGIPKSMSDRVFSACQERFQLNRKQLMLTFSHNHCGPRLGDDLRDYYPVDKEQENLVAQYTDSMVEQMVSLVGSSLQKMQVARLWQGQGRATFAVNRRNNREDDITRLRDQNIGLAGPVDHDVPVIQITDADERTIALLFGYACHPTTLSFNTWCGDYPGFAQMELEKSYPGCNAMFINTCGGDQNPLPRRRVELCEQYGRELAQAVNQAIIHSKQPISSQLNADFAMVELAYASVVQRRELETLASDSNAIRSRWATRLLANIEGGVEFASTYSYPIRVWKLGNEALFIGCGAETVVDYALKFKREYGYGTWVCGYCDDMIAYIPSRRVWEEGGYEGGSNLYEYGRPAFRWAGDIEERISSTVRRLVEAVKP